MAAPAREEHRTTRVRLGDKGRLVLPAAYREALGVKPGDEVILRLEEDGTVRITTIDQVLAEIQAMVREHVPEGHSLVDELIAERRADAARE